MATCCGHLHVFIPKRSKKFPLSVSYGHGSLQGYILSVYSPVKEVEILQIFIFILTNMNPIFNSDTLKHYTHQSKLPYIY